MLQIRLSKPASESGVNVKPAPVDTVTVACPDHLVLADLPVVKSLGSPCSTAVIKTVGRRSRRQLGERVHFCVRCDFPIAIYGRLSPCEHAFCLDCARSDSLCYLCDDRIQRIQTIKMMERIFICAAPHCLKSFLKRSEFESHIRGAHADLLNPKREKEANESEAMSARKPSAADTTVQMPAKLVFSPRSHPPGNDREDKIQLHPSNRDKLPSRPPAGQPRPVPIFSGQVPNYSSEQHPDSSNQSNIFPQQAFDSHGPGGSHQDSGGQKFFGAPYETTRPDSTPKPGSGQGPLMGLSTGPVGRIPFPSNYPPLWNMVPGTVPLEPPLVTHGPTDGITTSDPQSRGLFRSDREQNTGFVPMNAPPSLGNKGAEQGRGGNFANPREGRGILAAQPMGLPPPPPLPPPQLAQMPRGRPYSGDGSGNRDAPPPGFGWYGRRDGFGGGQD